MQREPQEESVQLVIQVRQESKGRRVFQDKSALLDLWDHQALQVLRAQLARPAQSEPPGLKVLPDRQDPQVRKA